MEIVYLEASLDDVLAYFAQEYVSDTKGKLFSHESFVDISKRKVVFKLAFEDKDAPQNAGN